MKCWAAGKSVLVKYSRNLFNAGKVGTIEKVGRKILEVKIEEKVWYFKRSELELLP